MGESIGSAPLSTRVKFCRVGGCFAKPTNAAGVSTGRSYFRNFTIANFVAIFCCSSVSATGYGDVEIVLETERTIEASHGYAEIWIRVTNRSKHDAHEVRLTIPKHSYYAGEDHIRSVSRTITVDAEKTARVALSYPNRLPIGGAGLSVTIDGREQKEAVAADFTSRSRYSGYRTIDLRPTVLYSRSIDTRFTDWAELARQTSVRIDLDPPAPMVGKAPPPPRKIPAPKAEFLPEGPRELPSLPGPTLGGGGRTPGNFVRADLYAANWSPNWLGYSRYDGIVLTDEDLRSMPEPVRSAIGDYVECGGSLLVLGKDPQLPGKWKPVKSPDQLAAQCDAGFGTCFVIDSTDLSKKPAKYLQRVVQSWSEVMRPWSNTRSPAQANAALPIVDNIGSPAGGLLALMFVFSIMAGPVTLLLLTRRGRKLWIFWIVPLISAITCLAVFGYMALSEGWSGRSRIVGITILDENTRRASSLGWSAFYTPLSSGGGLHFSPNTEVNFQNYDADDFVGYRSYRNRSSSTAALSIDWTREQHLTAGWLSPRVPAHFIVRKSENRRERITFSRGPDGRPEAVNGLGAELADLWYADESGNLFHAQNIAAGSKISLNAVESPPSGAGLKSFREFYTSDWSKAAEEAAKKGPALLKPRMYMAVMESAPFFDQGLQNANSRREQSVVIGIIKEGGDES